MTESDLKKTKLFKQISAININSSDEAWLKLAKSLDDELGREDMVTIFLKLWDKLGSAKASTFTLRSTLKRRYDLEIPENLVNKAIDIGGSALDSIGNIFKVGGITVLVIGGVVILASLAAVLGIIKSAGNAASLKVATKIGS